METALLWKQYKTQPSDILKNQIVLNYVKLVHYVIHRSKFMNNDFLDDRDYFQYGIEGLHEAIERFDPEYGTKFETYAIQRIRGKIIDELRKLQIKPRITSNKKDEEIYYFNVSLNHSIDADDGYQLYETIPADIELQTETIEKQEDKEILIEAIKQLDQRDRLIITLYYYENLNYKEIANTLNITVSRVSQVHSRIIGLLKRKINKINAA